MLDQDGAPPLPRDEASGAAAAGRVPELPPAWRRQESFWRRLADRFGFALPGDVVVDGRPVAQVRDDVGPGVGGASPADAPAPVGPASTGPGTPDTHPESVPATQGPTATSATPTPEAVTVPVTQQPAEPAAPADHYPDEPGTGGSAAPEARQPLSPEECRQVLSAAVAALDGVDAELFQYGSAALTAFVALADQLTALAAAARTTATAEAVWRGLPAETGQRTEVWLRRHAPSVRQGGARQIARLADDTATTARKGDVTTTSRRTSSDDGEETTTTGDTGRETSAVAAGLDPQSPLGIVWAGVRVGRVGAPLAGTVLRQMTRLQPRLIPDAVPTVTDAMIDIGVEHGPAAVEALRARLLADHGHPGEFDNAHQDLARAAFITQPDVSSGDLTEYRMGLTPTQAALLEAALGPLSAPAPNEETGELDLRPAGQRRAEALAQLCEQVIGADGDTHRRDGVAGSPLALFLTMSLHDLTHATGAGTVQASRAHGTLLSPGQVRRLSCDCALIPTVLGTDSEVLDMGRVVRLYTKAQRRRIWLRDRGCTYPGCTAPATWTRVHHIHHWLDGGTTNHTNAALLCQRHHTTVHQRRLWAVVRTTPNDHGRWVDWDLTPGSYDHALQHLRI